MNQEKILIFIPTYNEAENVERIFHSIKSLNFDSDILFIDDNSPDGTGLIIDKIAETNSGVFVIHRKGKSGIGSAHKAGIAWAYEHHYTSLITMDCDFTHSPEYIREFINHAGEADIVVGSRYMEKNSLATWNYFRKFLTWLGHFLTITLLNLPYDATGAFRLYNLSQINSEFFGKVQSLSYSFFFESLFLLHYNKLKIIEIAIELPSRTYGTSKMTMKDILNSFLLLVKLFYRKNFDKKSLNI